MFVWLACTGYALSRCRWQ